MSKYFELVIFTAAMSEPFINKVAESGLITLDLEKYYPRGETALFDMKDHLFMGMILKEKDFREALKTLDWSKYKDKEVALFCSADAIIPVWAWMLAAAYLQPVAKEIVMGDHEKEPTEVFSPIVIVLLLVGGFAHTVLL